MASMNDLSLPDGPALAYLRAVVAALGPHAGSTSGFTWPERYVVSPPVAICIGLGGTHVLAWNPFAGGWCCDRVDPEDCILDQAHRLVSSAVVPRPEDVVRAVMLQAERRLDQLPLYAAEIPVPDGTWLTASQRRAVAGRDLTEDVALRLAVYAAEDATLSRT
jgi:hypothetical protein